MRKALKTRSVPVEDNMNLVITTLTHIVMRGLLKAKKGPEGWTYWTE
jgi:hypothetical protein